jgi:hypothetical protein
MRFIFSSLFIIALLWTANLSAQQKQRSEETQRSFHQLRQSFQRQETGKPADPQVSERDRSHSVEAWVKRNSWRELPVQEQAWLAEAMSGPDQIDKRSFSVRWTGQLKVPANGRYTFTPFASAGAEGTMKLWLHDQIVLDSGFVADLEPAAQTEQQKQVNPNRSISLIAGKPVSFRLEYVRVSSKKQDTTNRLPGYPAAVLVWRSEVMEQQVVPAHVFIPPGDFQKEGKQGLRGEYFADAKFNKSVVVRLDPNVDFLWDVGRVASERRDSQKEIASAAVAKMTAPGFLDSLNPNDAQELIQKQLPALFSMLPASERVAVLKSISEHPNLLKLLSFPQMASALRWYATQADPALAVDLLVKWSKLSTPPTTKPGFVPGRSPGGYLTQNVEPYFKLARLFLGEGVEQRIEMLAGNAANEDGTCNLTVAYVLCCLCRLADKQKVMAEITDAHLVGEAAKNIPGDIKSTWRIAEAFKYETVYGADFRPGNGLAQIDRGLEEATDAEVRFRLIGELTARLIASDRSGEARSLIMSVWDQYPDEIKQAVMDSWLEAGTSIKEYYENLRAQKAEESDTFLKDAFAMELKRRAVVAEQRGDQKTLNRYQKTIKYLEEKQPGRQKEKLDK